LRPEERRREQELHERLQRLDNQVAALLQVKEPSDAHRRQADQLRQQRDAAQAEFAAFAAELAKQYGVTAGQVYGRERVRAGLPADAAVVAWVDVPGEPKSANPDGEHWACVLRARGEPGWVKLPGGGANGAWTPADDALAAPLRAALTRPPDR